MRLFIFGFGYTGARLAARVLAAGGAVLATSRTADGRQAIVAAGITPVDPGDPEALAEGVRGCDTLVIAAPPGEIGCPGLAALDAVLTAGPGRIGWIGYLSTTGVYGDRGGGWVLETTSVAPRSPEAVRRVAAERGWLDLGRRIGRPVALFRLPGIYGPGRSALDRVRSGEAQRIVKPGHVFSRTHVDDLAAGIARAADARAGGVFNLCDDAPGPAADVIAYAAELLGVAPPPEQPLDPEALSPMARRFWAESKRVSNARAKAAFGWRPAYPSYREGLTAILAQESAT